MRTLCVSVCINAKGKSTMERITKAMPLTIRIALRISPEKNIRIRMKRNKRRCQISRAKRLGSLVFHFGFLFFLFCFSTPIVMHIVWAPFDLSISFSFIVIVTVTASVDACENTFFFLTLQIQISFSIILCKHKRFSWKCKFYAYEYAAAMTRCWLLG